VANRRSWQPIEILMLRALYPHLPTKRLARFLRRSAASIYRIMALNGFQKSEEFLAGPLSGRLCGDRGIGCRFRKGHIPANKGLRRPGWFRGRMRKTQFKKGAEPFNAMPLWSFRRCHGYLILKTGKPGPAPTNGWEYLHKLIWEQAHGPLPDWKAARLWWKDGDHGNCSLDNLEMVTAQEHMHRTTIHNLPPELKHTIQVAGALKRRIRTAERKMQEAA